jgi:hypothetical protein
VRGERAGGAQTGGTATQDDGGPAEPHADQLPSFIQPDTECMNDGVRVSSPLFVHNGHSGRRFPTGSPG